MIRTNFQNKIIVRTRFDAKITRSIPVRSGLLPKAPLAVHSTKMIRTKFPCTAAKERSAFKKYAGLLAKVSISACHNFFGFVGGVESPYARQVYEEMRLQADFLFVKAYRRFNNALNIQFSTFLHTVVRNGLIDYGKRLFQHDDRSSRASGYEDEEGKLVHPIDTYVDIKAERAFTFAEDLMSMSLDARLLVDLAISGACVTCDHIRKYAAKELAYTPDQIEEAMDEIKDLVQSW